MLRSRSYDLQGMKLFGNWKRVTELYLSSGIKYSTLGALAPESLQLLSGEHCTKYNGLSCTIHNVTWVIIKSGLLYYNHFVSPT